MAALFAMSASAQLPFTPAANKSGVNQAVGTQNTFGPTGVAFQQSNYPYPGQCLADPLNVALFPLLNPCTANTGSFACTATGNSPQTAASWKACGGGSLPAFKPLGPLVSNSVDPTYPTPRFVHPVLNPIDYTPDKTTFPGADYYEIGVHEAQGFQAIASAGLFPSPAAGPAVPDGMQWTGLICNIPTGCTCPNGISAAFQAAYCSGAGNTIPAGNPLLTPIWGVGQINMGGGPVTGLLSRYCSVTTTQRCGANLPACPGGETCGAGLFEPGAPSTWSANNYVATWPSISVRANRGTPVVVKWVNEFPDNHLFCPHPEAADWPCAIDRTFMGVKATIDPALGNGTLPTEGVNQFGSPQQPDNSWVTHLHGGEIPPSTDGFAELWFGNATTAGVYNNLAKNFVSPPFENPSGIMLKRPAGNAAVYTYPMIQEEATIWFHDHTLGKTHHNVIAGPAGFFPVKEPKRHAKMVNGVCQATAGEDCQYTWLDPVTEPRTALGVPKYDLFLAIQDRAFNDDGSINFSTALGQAAAPFSPVTPGDNPGAHPVWVPEYFGDHALVNGVLWPKVNAEPGWYRMRLVDGSDSRCWTIGFQTSMPAPGARPVPNIKFYVIGSDQGYLPQPIYSPGSKLTMCPGERYELLINFEFNNGQSVYMTNEAAAPYPAGDLPFDTVDGLGTPIPSPYPDMNVIMRFDVSSANGPGVRGCVRGLTWDPAWTQQQMTEALTGTGAFAPRVAACMPRYPHIIPAMTDIYAGLPRPALPATIDGWPAGTIVRQVYLNERIDGVTQAPMGMQLNGVPFEYKVTETPRQNSVEIWRFVNLTVDAHPMHPHLVKHQIVGREKFNVRGFLSALCGTAACSPGPAPGMEMQSIPDVEPFLYKPGNSYSFLYPDGGWKDASQVPPGQVTTIVARWEARWTPAQTAAAATAPGTAGCPNGASSCAGSAAAGWTYEPVTSGPYVWHCHINSHEDSEMMRTSLVVP
jgi:FtsP/CotA-like multicopper oxidase with cupredoxin domain